MNSLFEQKKNRTFKDRFEWEVQEQRAYNRFIRKMKRLGCAIIIITCIWSLGWIYKIVTALME